MKKGFTISSDCSPTLSPDISFVLFLPWVQYVMVILEPGLQLICLFADVLEI